MAASRVVVYISSESELARKLQDAADDGETIIINTDDAQYEVDVHLRRSAEHPETPDADPILSIFGLFASGEPNDVAPDKYRHIADNYSGV